MTKHVLGAVLVFGVLAMVGPEAVAQEDTAIRPFTINVPDAVLADLEGAAEEPAASPSAARRRLEPRYRRQVPAGAGGLLARPLRLAGPGAAPECDGAVHDHHRRPDHPLHAPAIEAPERLPAARHPRLAGVDRRVHEDHRPAHRSGGARRPGRRCLRRRHALDSRLRLLGQAAGARVRPGADRGARGEADGAAGLRALRRPGRRLGLDHQHAGGAGRSRARRRTAPEHVLRRRAGRRGPE